MNAIDVFDKVKNVPEVISVSTRKGNEMIGATKAVDFVLVGQDNGLVAGEVYRGVYLVKFFAANSVDEAIEFIITEHNKWCGINHAEKVDENLNPPTRVVYNKSISKR